MLSRAICTTINIRVFQNEMMWKVVWQQFRKRKIGVAALYILVVFFLLGLYAPLLSSSKPLLVIWNKTLYFPLLRYLFYPGFYTKPIDLFYNLLMFMLPVSIIGLCFIKKWRFSFIIGMIGIQTLLFFWFLTGAIKDPASDPVLKKKRIEALEEKKSYREDPLLAPIPSETTWAFDVQYMTPYEKLNYLLRYRNRRHQHERLKTYASHYLQETGRMMPTLWAVEQRQIEERRTRLIHQMDKAKESYQVALDHLPLLLNRYQPYSHSFIMAKYRLLHQGDQEAQDTYTHVIEETTPYRAPLVDARNIIQNYQHNASELDYLNERHSWLEKESQALKVLIPPFVRTFHWEEDAGGAQEVNRLVPWWELTRVNRKDLVASLLFGIRVSLVVGFSAVFLSLIIGVPLGMIAGYFAGKTDIIICRLVEIWEAMPTFFMLLLIIAITQSKSIFVVIAVLGFFGWPGICRFIRAEVLRQRKLPYVMACKSLGFRHPKIMFSHILPNAIPPVLTLIPFAMMAAITSEAGLSFLGLGEEGSTSWGVLMDEGRAAFPAESYLLWPPAIFLTILLISIALVGDNLRDAIDPKMRS